MIVNCMACQHNFDDEFRSTTCPHDTFAANDGHNNFAHHPDSYLGDNPIPRSQCGHCGGSGIEFVDGGNGNVLELECSYCKEDRT